MKKIICTLMTLLLFVTTALPVYAATNVRPVVSVYKYNDTSGKYDIATQTATKGDLLLVRVAFNQEIASLSSVRVTLHYTGNKVSYLSGSFTPELVPGDRQAGMPILTEKESKIVAFWGKDNLLAGSEILGLEPAGNIASFLFLCDDDTGTVDFKATLDSALSADFQDVAMVARSSTTTVTLETWSLPEETKEVFEKLKTIIYAPGTERDSKADIDMADMVWSRFSKVEKLNFVSEYPALYDNYKYAWTRYYDASLEAEKAAIQAEVDRFVAEHQTALSVVKPEDVSQDNYQEILNAIEDYGKLTANAQVVALDYKAQLDTVSERAMTIADMVKADAEAQEYFISPYENILWNLSDDAITDETYADYMTYVAEATAEYDNLELEKLSNPMKKKVNDRYAKLKALSKTIEDIAKKVGEDQAIQDEITAFTAKWHVVTRLTALTVGVNDKTALEMMLEDFENLSDTAKQRLASRKSTAEQLLALIGGMNQIQNGAGTNAGISLVPEGGTTQTIIKEVPTETIVTQSQIQLRNIPKIVYVMIWLTIFSVLSCVIPLIIYVIYRKKMMEMRGVNSV